METFTYKITQLPNGDYAAHSEQEPLFCFVRKSKAELRELVKESFISYKKLFAD